MWSWILDNEEVLAHWGTFCHRGVKIHMLRFWEISQSTRFDMSAFRLLWNLTESGWYMPFEFDVCMTVHQWYNNKISQIDTTVIILLTISISSTCFGPQFRPFSGAQDCVYRLWYKTPAMLPAGDQDEVKLVITSCKHSLMLLRMGEIIARNMLSWLKLFVKLLLLHLVGCLCYCISDARSHKHHIYRLLCKLNIRYTTLTQLL